MQTGTLRAINTRYKGYLMRSRLEARWAVFFDALGISYRYEWQGYDLGAPAYLPDFWLPDYEVFVEIKPDKPRPAESDKAYLLARTSGKPAYIFFSDVWPAEQLKAGSALGYIPVLPGVSYTFPGSVNLVSNVFVGMGFQWTECPFCHRLEVVQEGLAEYLSCDCARNHGYKGRSACTIYSKLQRAYEAARSARFDQRKGDAG